MDAPQIITLVLLVLLAAGGVAFLIARRKRGVDLEVTDSAKK